MNLTMKKIALYFFLMLSISGCDYLFDKVDDAASNLIDTYIDCTFGPFHTEGPIQISTLEFSNGLLGVNYSQVISSEINFEPDDDKYTYEYTYTPDQLPNGLSFRANGRRLVIEGVPQVTGMYPVLIEVYSPTLEDKNSDISNSCRPDSKASMNYILIID